MKISSHIATSYGLDIQKAAGNNKPTDKQERVKKGDSVSVSKEASSITDSAASVETATNHIASLPESRSDKIASVKEKIDNGYYETEQFRGDLAEKLIKTFTSPVS